MDHDHAQTIALAERVLGPGLTHCTLVIRQEVAEAIGNISPTACPVARLYRILALNCTSLGGVAQEVLAVHGISMEDYEAFLAFNDSTDQEAHAALRAWILRK